MYNRFMNQQQQSRYLSFSGTVTNISDFGENGCSKLFEVQNSNQTVDFVVNPNTYFVNNEKIYVGMQIIGFYDANLPVILIYPPRYQAVVIGSTANQMIKVDRFNRNLISQDNTLKLNLSPATEIILTNGQDYTGSLENKDLIVVYTTSTRSIPAQTTPEQIIVIC